MCYYSRWGKTRVNWVFSYRLQRDHMATLPKKLSYVVNKKANRGKDKELAPDSSTDSQIIITVHCFYCTCLP